MKNFIHRTITEETTWVDDDGNTIPVLVMRTRTSAGCAGISVRVGNQRIDFDIAGKYESHARELAAMLEKICNEPCLLPKTERQP